MLEGVDKGIVALPVHDAVAVTQDNADWAKEAMLRAWFEHANSGGSVARSRVKADYPVTSYQSFELPLSGGNKNHGNIALQS